MLSFIFLEVSMYVGLIVFLILITQYADLSQDTLFGCLTLLMYFASIVRITKRIEREKAGKRLRSSVFTYGFICGAFYWFLFVLSEMKGTSVITYLQAIPFIILVGAIAGSFAVIVSAAIRSFISGNAK